MMETTTTHSIIINTTTITITTNTRTMTSITTLGITTRTHMEGKIKTTSNSKLSYLFMHS